MRPCIPTAGTWQSTLRTRWLRELCRFSVLQFRARPGRMGRLSRSADTFGGWARQVALQHHIGFIDLNEIIARRYDFLGVEKVEPLFGDPHTHTSRAGAELNAECVV